MAISISCGLFAFENRTYQEVIKELSSGCNLKKENIFLTNEQGKKIKNLLDTKVSSLVLRYKNECNGNYFYVDSHIVRTLNETVIVEVANKKASRFKIASFMEPKEYLPPQKWLDNLVKNPQIDGLTGATLSSNALKKVMQKVLVINKVVDDK